MVLIPGPHIILFVLYVIASVKKMWEGEVTACELNNGGKCCKPSFPFQLCMHTRRATFCMEMG